MKRKNDFFIEDKTENYEKGNPYFTTLLGEEFYPNDFWINFGGILIRTNETIEEIQEKIKKVLHKPVYSKQVTFKYQIHLAANFEFKHPDDNSKVIPGIQVYNFFVKYHKEKTLS